MSDCLHFTPKMCISIWKIFLFVFTDTFDETQIVRHLYSMFGFVIPRRPVALAHGVLAEQPMTDGGGRFGL